MRQAISEGLLELVRHGCASGIVAFQEAEKGNLLADYAALVAPIALGEADIVVPMRTREAWLSLPVEQMHSESFGNLHVANLLRERSLCSDCLDWFFGPICFSHHMAVHWLAYDGPQWDAQIVPALRALASGARVVGVAARGYLHPPVQKELEQGKLAWSSKRLLQLRLVVDKIQDEMAR